MKCLCNCCWVFLRPINPHPRINPHSLKAPQLHRSRAPHKHTNPPPTKTLQSTSHPEASQHTPNPDRPTSYTSVTGLLQSLSTAIVVGAAARSASAIAFPITAHGPII
jgi:hypothetical protein